MITGWLQSNGKYYYFDSDGKMVAGRSITIEGKEYTFDTNGVCTNLSGTPGSVTNAISETKKSEQKTESKESTVAPTSGSGSGPKLEAPGAKPETSGSKSESSSSAPSSSSGSLAPAAPIEESKGSKESTAPASPLDEAKSKNSTEDSKSKGPSEESKSPSDESKKNSQNNSSSKDEVGLKPGETSGPK